MNRIHRLSLSLAAVALLGACSEQSATGLPGSAAEEFKEAERVLPVETPDAAYWWGYENGVFWLELDPTVTNIIGSGENQLTIPANSICDVETTSYGAGEWDKQCVAERDRVRFTIKPGKTADGRTRMDFYPHVRFSPNALPQLRLYDPSRTWERSFEILYCASELDQSIWGGCINEALHDSSLKTYRSGSYFFRKLKHFSGYEVAAT